MMLMEAKEVLENAGYEVSEQETLKGSVKVKGLTIGTGHIRPTVYAQSFNQIETEEELISLAEKVTSQCPDINLELCLTREFILDHAVSCVRHQTDDEQAVKWPVYGDLEEYIRVYMGTDSNDTNMSIVLSKQILDQADVSADEVRIYARRNLRQKVTIESMVSVLSQMMGSDIEDMSMMTGCDMWVGTTVDKLNGAAIMILSDLLQSFCEEHGLQGVHIIPSSLHEVLLVPDYMDEDVINDMIVDINETQVDPTDRLSSHCYHFAA